MTRMTSSEAFVEQLAAEGVTDVFGIVGSAYMDALDLFPPAGIRFVSVAHEQNAAHMADGYARATNRHGVCIAQNGPGITNFVTAIAAAGTHKTVDGFILRPPEIERYSLVKDVVLQTTSG
jgi:sulfoacetaldehyde acetyltransferase